MVSSTSMIAAAGVAVAAVAVYAAYQKGKADGAAKAQREQSQQAHEEATDREPPVEVGDSVSLGIKEFKSHHSGDQVAVCKKEGFVIFVDDAPESAEVGDVIDAEVVSFGEDRTSAQAEYVGD
jgi:predicted RNA-binding protein with TRAM domain